MKDKNLAGILALFLGWLGIHRFYLGQIGLGIVYAMFFWISWIIGIIDAIAFFSMDKDNFDIKYNKEYYKAVRRKETDFDRSKYRHRSQRYQQDRPKQRSTQRPDTQRRERIQDRSVVRKHNPYKQSGIRKFREFDYQGAIQDFEKALEIAPKDVALHFNLACAYSLNENVEKAFHHLDKAVEYGFNDFERIKDHDALAFLRIHPDFEKFAENGYRTDIPRLELQEPSEEIEDEIIDKSADLLQQLKKLGELREKGLLSEAEFEKQKQKLLRRGDD